nr:MAG: hypothetical protein DIU57_17055 [Pseudomonadota bacterium]
MIRHGVRRLAASIQRLSRLRRFRPVDVSHAFLIGAMKCGTWTMFKLLRGHPQIAASRPKELKFFSTTPRAEWHRYHEYFDLTPSTKVLLEGTTQYSKHPDTTDVAFKISLYDRSSKFIYLMRDPIRRVESQLAHRVARREIPEGADARAREIRRAINYSKYFTQLGIYASIFGVEQIYARTFESFVADQEGTVRECCEFLGIEQPSEVHVLPPQNVRKRDNGADKIALTAAEKHLIRETLYREVLSLEAAFGISTRAWKDFWQS